MKVGTCGWSSFPASSVLGKDWKKMFKSKLQAYARTFPVVEINSTFYKLPRESTARRWLEEAREVNPEFEFTVKANQVITHKDRFAGKPSLEAWQETSKIARLLEARIILLQTPASFKASDESLAKLESFLENIDWDGRIAWEPRGDWLEKPKLVKAVCQKFGLIHCVDPFRAEQVTREIYWRLHGLGKPSMYNYKFSDEELKWLARKARGKEGYVFFNNIWMGEDALRFLAVLDSN